MERVSLEGALQRIEDDSEAGLYWILCFIYLNVNEISPDVVRQVKLIQVERAANNAVRHMRDYVVLVGFLRFLDHVVDELKNLKIYQS